MSKTGQWVLSMQEDAWDMTREEFIQKHGPSNVDIWDDEKAKAEGEPTAEDINQMYMEKGI
tara:strand:- start:84 stop:266 length:183 start_codon:yes stop_codon:yes gene_type:complete